MGVHEGLSYSNAWLFWFLQRKAALSNRESQGDYCLCTMDSQKRQAIVLLWSCQPRSFFNFRPPIVHIQALFSPTAHHPKPPTLLLTQSISPINPSRNVALVMERMPGACPAGAAASRRTAACTSASPVWTVDSSTASRRATARLPAMQCVATVCRGETHSAIQLYRIMCDLYVQLWRLKHFLCLDQILQED